MASSSERTLLSFDLVEEILCQIPIESLIRFQLICKQWYSLFKNKRFIYRYLDFPQERFMILNRTVQIIDPVTQTRLISPIPGEFPEKPFISTMIHCDGLLLLRFSNWKSEKLLIWNPILGKIKWIQPIFNPLYTDTYGIGYDRDDYKILRFRDGIYDEVHGNKDSYEIKIQIYDLKSNSWRIVDITLDWSISLPCEGVSVNGNMYWKAYRRNDPKMFIQSFDFSSQTFKPVCGNPIKNVNHGIDTIALSNFRRDRLSLLHKSEERKKIKVWVTNKVNSEVVSWSKYLSVVFPDLPSFIFSRDVHFIVGNDKIRLCCEEENEDESFDGSFTVYEIGKDEMKKQVRGRCDSRGGFATPFCSSYVYVPSLVPPE